mmetsp:Transcript_38925/g.69706  ORF Transcript_38925/g.69706 Transcript_38925/m.69706 type:complete len:558 (-) Transcript_38925:145-1818(-)|eukprot:CAMPEP_0177782128 /NCGR_PEP_ID=MMETSP0491_2-20121128/18272_1 /TAXON_ID=63592 /ORGANISM="Tetraselmis chuii, Strain PLY429" /LENGTH=557 /DNA_ID=CAMNT_0019302347 /DNA_START=279 /DNA_END=1952 /DNA_ORIENTATION=+
MAAASVFATQVTQLEEAMVHALALPGSVEEAVEAFLRASFSYTLPQPKGLADVKPIEQDDRVTFRHCTRILLDSIATCASEVGAPLMQFVQPPGTLPTVSRLLDVILWLSDKGAVEPGMIFMLLEDVVEAATVDECRDVFTYMESQVSVLRQPHLFDGKLGGKLVMLRCCNQLLRRLSKGNNELLCGRISMLLSWLLPVWDKSGLNQLGATNTTNPLVIEDVQEGATDSNGAPIDVQFYRTFWGLQKHFQRPLAALEAANWGSFCAELRTVLAAFEAQPLAAGAMSGTWSGGGVKYLTSSRLIHLQLQDPSFRRNFLVQCLILFHFARKAVVGREERATLGAEQRGEVEALEAAVVAQLRATPHSGPKFAEAVQKLLERESAWVAWKASGAPSFDRTPNAPPAPADEKPPRKRSRVASHSVVLGRPALDHLWNLTESNTSCLNAEDRGDLPTCREFLEVVLDQMEPEEGIEDAYKQKEDKVYLWKALRLLARQNLQVFSDTMDKAAGDLEYAALKLYPDAVSAGAKAREKYAVEEPPSGKPKASASSKQATAEGGNK